MSLTPTGHAQSGWLQGHQRAIMGLMTVEEIFQDRHKFSEKVFDVASSDLVNMGISVVSYTLKDIRDDEGYLRALGMRSTGTSWCTPNHAPNI